jgi:GT2 family glycosyltransferase
MNVTKIAVLLTCHNRKLKTLACLSAFFAQTLPEKVEVCVYLVDDGSTDGTEEAVRQTYPQVKVLQGDGNLFWNGGMSLAWTEAMQDNYDYYLWLNDDTNLYPNALKTLLATSRHLVEQGCHQSIVVGSTQDPETKAHTYGGLVKSSWWHPLKFRLLEPDLEIQICDTMHGNCVLIPKKVVQTVGNLDSNFVHGGGDWDYGLRAKRKGCQIWIAPGYLATCSCNSLKGTWEDKELTLKERLKQISHPKGLPLNEWKIFAQRYAGSFWIFYWLLPYLRVFLIPLLSNR